MKTIEQVSGIMTKEVLTVDVNDSLKNANNLFGSKHIRHLPVVSNGNLVGILSQSDILRISFGNTFNDDTSDSDVTIFDMLSINQVMKHSPKTVTPTSSLKEVAQTLAEKEFHALPVVDNGKLVGIVTTTDLIKHFINLLE